MQIFPPASMTSMIPRSFIAASTLVLTCALPVAAYARVGSPQVNTFSQAPFIDVSPSDPSFDAIEFLRTNNILKGYLDGTFHPRGRISRGEFVTLMTNEFFLHGRENDCIVKSTLTSSTVVFFPDVQKSVGYATDVCIAKTRDLVHGYPDGYFRPGRPVSFVEGAKVIARVFALDVRKDRPADSRWYHIYVQTLADFHAIPPTIDPSSLRSLSRPLTRAEVAEIIYRLTQAQRSQ